MKRLDKNTVELNPNEAWVIDRFNLHLDEGLGVIDAAEEAMLDFWVSFPLAERDLDTSPLYWEFFLYITGCEQDQTPLVQQGWDNAEHYTREDSIEGTFQLHDALHIWQKDGRAPKKDQ